MSIPLQVVFHEVDASPAVTARIEARALDLERFAGSVSRCRVVVESPPGHHQKGRHWRVLVECGLHGDELVVGRGGNDPAHEDVYVALDDAFDAMIHRLQEHFDRRREARAGRP